MKASKILLRLSASFALIAVGFYLFQGVLLGMGAM